MPRKTTPKYRLHKARNCAVVTINGRDHYLGTYDSPDSWEMYHRLVAEHLAERREPPPPVAADTPLTVTELIARYWRFAKSYDVKDEKPTSEVHAIKLALRFVRRLYGTAAACEFSPKKLKAVREAMIAHQITRKVKGKDEESGTITWTCRVVRTGMARKCINKLVGRVKRMFAWAVEEELVPVAVHAALARVKGLKRGKTAARETPRVRPVPDEDVQKVLAVLPPLVRAMTEVQWLCGCRPQDVVQMRPCDIDTSGPVWEYRPPRFKTEHHNDDKATRYGTAAPLRGGVGSGGQVGGRQDEEQQSEQHGHGALLGMTGVGNGGRSVNGTSASRSGFARADALHAGVLDRPYPSLDADVEITAPTHSDIIPC